MSQSLPAYERRRDHSVWRMRRAHLLEVVRGIEVLRSGWFFSLGFDTTDEVDSRMYFTIPITLVLLRRRMALDDIPGVEIDEQAQKADQLAEEMEEISNGLLSKKEAKAYLLMKKAQRDVSEASEFMSADVSELPDLRNSAVKKIEGAEALTDFLE